ncbi:MAG: TetR/AcrR family transcriptional regulator [Planctomycetota bacterium]|jgi:AcrR family transcriptional regulator
MARIPEKRKKAWEELMKKDVYEAVRKVFEKHSLDKLTMDRVAEAAGISKGTLYNYFENKDDLVCHVVGKAFEPLLEKLDALVASGLTPGEKLREFARGGMSFCEDNKQLFRMLLSPDASLSAKLHSEGAERRMKVVKHLRKVLEQGIAEGCFRKVDPERTAAMILGSVAGFNIMSIQSGKSFPLEDSVNEYIGIIINGIGTGDRQQEV